MATDFWAAKGVIMLDFLPKKSTITGVYYANLLDQLRAAIREKRRGKLSKGVLLQQDNARVHTCKVAMDAVDDDDEFRFNDASTHEGHLRQNGELTWFCSETIIMISHKCIKCKTRTNLKIKAVILC